MIIKRINTLLLILASLFIFACGESPLNRPKDIVIDCKKSDFMEHSTDEYYIASWKASREDFKSVVEKMRVEKDPRLLERWPNVFNSTKEWWSPSNVIDENTFCSEGRFVKYESGRIYLKIRSDKTVPTSKGSGSWE